MLLTPAEMMTSAPGECCDETFVIAKHSYTAENNQELSIRKSERLILLDNSKDWWRVKNMDNQQVISSLPFQHGHHWASSPHRSCL